MFPGLLERDEWPVDELFHGSELIEGCDAGTVVGHPADEAPDSEGEGGSGDGGCEGHGSVPDDFTVALAPLPADPPSEPKAGFACPLIG